MIKSFFKNDLFLSLLIASIFILTSIFLPVFDYVNGFHNLIFDNYNLAWYDGKSPANFYIVKNILEGKSIFFPKNYLIGEIKAEDYFDFVEKNDSYFPVFNFYPNYVYAGILYPIAISSNLQLFKSMIILTVLFSSVTLSFFYLIQRYLGLNSFYSSISTIIAGIATSVLIYTRYLFIDHSIMNLMFVSLIYILLKNQKMRSFKIEIFSMIIFSFFIAFLWYEYLLVLFLVVLSYLFIKYEFIRSKKNLIIPIIIVSLILIPLTFLYSGITQRTAPPGIKNVITIQDIPIFRIFSNYINALDYSVFGYHNQTSFWKPLRSFAYIYAFGEQKGNAIFLATYGIFGSLFGSRGVVFNSPYLIFSILGIFAYKKEKERNFLLSIIVLIILCYAFLHLRWQGGWAPRYVRYYTIPIFFLTFFSFYYIQKTKNILAKLIFLILVILSVLNVASLAVRADWTYEHETDLVSYDLVLWPWIKNDNYLGVSEIHEWKGGNIVNETMSTDIYGSYAERTIKFEKNKKTLEVEACADFAAGDGTKGSVYIDDSLIGEIFIRSNSCEIKTFPINITGEHKIKLKTQGYRLFDKEWVLWKSMLLKK